MGIGMKQCSPVTAFRQKDATTPGYRPVERDLVRQEGLHWRRGRRRCRRMSITRPRNARPLPQT